MTNDDLVVRLAVLEALASASKAWVNFNGTGTPALTADYGVTSVADVGVGQQTITLDTAFSDTNYAGFCTAQRDTTPEPAICGQTTTTPKTATTFGIAVCSDGGTMFDSDAVYAAFFGDQ